MGFILCGIAFWGAPVIANANEEKASRAAQAAAGQLASLLASTVIVRNQEMIAPKPE